MSTREQNKYVQLDDLTVNNLGVLKRINSVVLPTSYSETWYKDSLTVGELAKLAFYKELPVGAIRCALETPSSENEPTKIYIMTLAVLGPYRQHGIGSTLLNHVIDQAKQKFIHEVYVHVWVENEDAIAWYEKRGFAKGDVVKGYYQKMQPAGDAVVMVYKC
ncbi:N-alpha-acetyltransferase Nat5p [Trichomonascus vanleenenianus]|uniref:peptide alpha-N-acetyltransferase subunit NAT5 n=1 Tax=Trichomonascus vanleenenianus TaxID=2268995 RepID=UPI003EC98115